MSFIKGLRVHHPIDVSTDPEKNTIFITDRFECNWTGDPTIVIDIDQIDELIEALQEAKQDVLNGADEV
jgi:hypothetical protein